MVKKIAQRKEEKKSKHHSNKVHELGSEPSNNFSNAYEDDGLKNEDGKLTFLYNVCNFTISKKIE